MPRRQKRGKFSYETRRRCAAANCGRTVDAVRSVELEGLRVSRHLGPAGGLCPGSLVEVVDLQP